MHQPRIWIHPLTDSGHCCPSHGGKHGVSPLTRRAVWCIITIMKISSLTVELIGLGVGIVGLISSFYFYRRSKESPRPCYLAASMSLIGGVGPLLPSEVRVTYKDEPVSSLKKTYVVFWNSGTKTLDAESVVSSDPIRIVLNHPDSRMLRIRLTKVSRKLTGLI